MVLHSLWPSYKIFKMEKYSPHFLASLVNYLTLIDYFISVRKIFQYFLLEKYI